MDARNQQALHWQTCPLGLYSVWACMCIHVYCISVCVSGCVPVWVYCDSEAYHVALPPRSLAEQSSVTVAKTCISTFSSLHKGPCKPCIMQTGNLCPLSSFCGHCYACLSLLSAHATRRTPQPRRQRRRKKIPVIGWPYLAIWTKLERHLFDKADFMDVYAIKEKQLFICVFFFSFEILLGCICTVSLRGRDRLIF